MTVKLVIDVGRCINANLIEAYVCMPKMNKVNITQVRMCTLGETYLESLFSPMMLSPKYSYREGPFT